MINGSVGAGETLNSFAPRAALGNYKRRAQLPPPPARLLRSDAAHWRAKKLTNKTNPHTHPHTGQMGDARGPRSGRALARAQLGGVGVGVGQHSSAGAHLNGANLWPRFALEPAPLVEFGLATDETNLSARLQCRPKLFAGPNWPATPTRVQWRRAAEFGRGGAEEEGEEDKEQLVARADGSLELAQTNDWDAQVLRCCLSNALGALCSRPVRLVRAQSPGKWIGLHCGALD